MLSREDSEWPFVSIVILNFNGGEFVLRCLNSVLSANYLNFEVILVDNASTDGSVDLVKKFFSSNPRFKIICNPTNLGFAEGNNIGAKYAKGKYIVFLNNDTEVDLQWLRKLIKVMEIDSRIGAAQCKLLFKDDPKRINDAGHFIDYFGVLHTIGFFEEDKGQYDYVYEIFSATGAAFIVKRKVFEEVGGFDSDFFLLFEESDLCWRIWLNGYRVVFAPAAIVYHRARALYRKGVRHGTGIEKSIYFLVRNRVMSMLKNYSLESIIKYLPVHIIFLFGLCLIKIRKRDVQAILRAMMWNLFNLKRTFYKRIEIQKMRKISDKFLMEKDIIKKPNMREIFEKVG